MKKEEELPCVSIIIPVYNRAELIEDCLNSLINLDYPKEKLEIIVVDDGSTDVSIEVIKSFRNLAPNIALLSSKRKGSASARKLGISYAKGEIIAFTDSDCKVDDKWLKVLIKNFQDEKVVAVGGKTRYYGVKNYINKILERKGIKITYFYALRKKLKLQYAPTCNLAVRKEIFKNISYGEDFFHGGDDIDLGIKIQKSGFEIKLDRKAVVYHSRETKKKLLSTLKTNITYGKADFILQLKYRDKRKTIFPPPVFIFLYFLLLAILTTFVFNLNYLSLPVIYLLLYIFFDYILILFTRSKTLYDYYLGAAVNYNPIEYILSFLIRCSYDIGIFLKKITNFGFSPSYFIVDDRTFHNIKRSNKKEIFINLVVFTTILLLMKK